ncbi:MAG TPA: hypothetical protein VM345_08475 [Acidimicrobiales bacterium]|nr:hypothetical protein [Acidimicrobiales bacterium]
MPVALGHHVLGALRFSFEDRRLFDDDERRFVLALAAEAASALQRARLVALERSVRDRSEKERRALEKVAAIAQVLRGERDNEAILHLAVEAAIELTGPDG